MNTSGLGVGLPSSGLRAWRWMIAAPASAASIDCSAISEGVNGRCGDMVGVWIEPVAAHVMITFFCFAAMQVSPREIRYGRRCAGSAGPPRRHDATNILDRVP